MKKEKQSKIEQWLIHKSDASERAFYAIRRLDLLIVSISGACIYIVLETLKFLYSSDAPEIKTCTALLKISAIFAVFAIIVNLISQITGLYSNKYETEYASQNIYIQEEEKDKDRDKQEYDESNRLMKLADDYGNYTRLMNIISTSLMFLPIIFLLSYNLITF